MNFDVVALLAKEEALPAQFWVSALKNYGGSVVGTSSDYRQGVLIKKGSADIFVSVNPDNFQKGVLNVLLTDRPLSEAKLIKGWDIIILSAGDVLHEPIEIEDTVIISGSPKGKKLGILTLQVAPSVTKIGYSHNWLVLGADA